MTREPAQSKVGLVKEIEHLRVGLEFEPGTDPIRGRLITEAGQVHAFEGWLQIAALFGSIISSDLNQSTLEGSS